MEDNEKKMYITENYDSLNYADNSNCEIICKKFLRRDTKLFCNNPAPTFDDIPSHFYVKNIKNNNIVCDVNFQKNIADLHNIDGISNEELIVTLITRLKYLQRSKFACVENESAIYSLFSALYALLEASIRIQNKYWQ